MRFAHDPADTEETRLAKTTIFLVAGICSVAGLVWTAMYAFAFGWGFTAALPLGFTVIVGGSLLTSHRTRNHYHAVYAQIVCIIYITALIQWSIGGVFDSGVVLVWAFCGPICALIFFSMRQSIVWFGLYVVNIGITVALDDTFAASRLDVSDNLRLIFFVLNLCVASLVVFIFSGYFVSRARIERARAEKLLLNILPREIAPRLKAEEGTIADAFESASVLFADMVGSTPLFAGMSPEEVVSWLNEAFCMFDRLIEKHGVEKVRTIGDNYMVAAGVPVPRPDHAQALVALALDMIDGLEQLPARNGRRMEFRFGIHSGPLIAGVIGESKFQYDLWGDTVNTAARMESHSEVGKIHISAATYDRVKDTYPCISRGTIEIKGKGPMETYFVSGRPET